MGWNIKVKDLAQNEKQKTEGKTKTVNPGDLTHKQKQQKMGEK